MTYWQKFGWLLLFFGLCELPAYANNPPQPDGLFSVLLILPLVILGARLAGVAPIQKNLGKRVATGIGLGICALFAMAGTEIALIPLLIILVYGIVRGAQIMSRGQGRKRVLIATTIFVWVPIACFDYLASLNAYSDIPARYEAEAVSQLRTLAVAESQCVAQDKKKNRPSSSCGTISELRKGGLIEQNFVEGQDFHGYRYGEIVDLAMGQYIFYVLPSHAPQRFPHWWHLVPGGTLISALFHLQGSGGTGERSFAVDESGVIRYAYRNLSSQVTREEVEQWKSLY